MFSPFRKFPRRWFFVLLSLGFLQCNLTNVMSNPQDFFDGDQLVAARRIQERDHHALEVLCGIMTKEELSQPGKGDLTLLFWAAAEQDSRAVRILLKHGADPDQKFYLLEREAHVVAVTAKMEDPEILLLILEYGGDPNLTYDKTPAIFKPLESQDLTRLKLFIDAGADVDAVDGLSGLPLMVYATTFNQYEAIVMLLEAGADWVAKESCNGCLAYQIQSSRGALSNEMEVWRQRAEDFLIDKGVKFPVPEPWLNK